MSDSADILLHTRAVKRYGWRRDLPDPRDYRFMTPAHLQIAATNSLIDLRPHCPPVYDQGDLGSCTANGIGFCVEFDLMRQQLPADTPSRLFIYYFERVIEGSVHSDAGAEIRDGIKVIAALGAPPETDWPYDISRFDHRPPGRAVRDALQDRAVEYSRVVQSTFEIKGCLSEGFPVVFGCAVFESFESDAVTTTGDIPMPDWDREGMLGGHCMAIVGADDAAQRYIIRNSWSAGWGNKGYGTMPYDYLNNTDLASDFWNVRLIGKPAAAFSA